MSDRTRIHVHSLLIETHRHPGRVADVGPRLLIRREIPAYLAASLYI